jgi:hypothetical protein
MEHRAGIEPANTGFADQRVSHFATGALVPGLAAFPLRERRDREGNYCGCATVRRYGLTVL